jgi:RNA polymerase sigma-70 factor (ECF subfamily)
LEAADHHTATRLAFEAYGSEILSFLIARLRGQSDGQEAFSMFAEDLWKGLPGLQVRCSVRGWMYAIARNAANRYAASPQRKPGHAVTLAPDASLTELVERARSVTALHLRTDVKTRVRRLREQLDIEDQTLLMLHVDRGLPWRELVLVMHDDSAALEDAELDREAARLRKRFERVKAELKRLAIREGLISR